jgi:hypothetical protein
VRRLHQRARGTGHRAWSGIDEKTALGAKRDGPVCEHLTDAFVDSGADGRGHVERSLVRDHGEGQDAIGECVEDVKRETGGFLAEDKTVATAKVGIKEAALGLC